MMLFQFESSFMSEEEQDDLHRFLSDQRLDHVFDDTLTYTNRWLRAHVSRGMQEKIITELEQHGAFSDNDVLEKCYL